MSVKYALLGIISERERHGYDLKEAFESHVGEFWTVNYGQIYRTLDRLGSEGLVEWREEPQDKRPDRKVYRITPKGVRELRAWLTQPVAGPRPLRDELFVKLLFVNSENRDAILTLIDRQREVYLEQMQRLTERKFELSQRPDAASMLSTDLLMDAALFHADADIRWLEHCAQKLRMSPASKANAE
jgi:DNA-binding PadR family transcriptional regulator